MTPVQEAKSRRLSGLLWYVWTPGLLIAWVAWVGGSLLLPQSFRWVALVPFGLMIAGTIVGWFLAFDAFDRSLAARAPAVRADIGPISGWLMQWRMLKLLDASWDGNVRDDPELRERASALHALTFGPLLVVAAIVGIIALMSSLQ